MPTSAIARRPRYARAKPNSRWRTGLGGGIAVGMRVMPLPRGPHNRIEIGKAWRPSQFGPRLGGRREEGRGIARAAGRECPRHLQARDMLHRMNHFPDRVRTAGAQVVRLEPSPVLGCLKRPDVRTGEIRHMDIVPKTGAVGCRIVV